MNDTIVIDAMGGDKAPQQIVEGAVLAAKLLPEKSFVLIGSEVMLKVILGKDFPSNIIIENASETIYMNEHPSKAVKRKTDSSIVKGIKQLKEGKAQAFFSAGNTGATMAAASLYLGRIRGIKRPAIAVTLPLGEKPIVVIDAGANIDCRPEHLFQFGIMGDAFVRKSLGIEEPRIGLLSVGEEDTKGNELVIKANDLFRQSKLNFFGNIEGNDIPEGNVDLVITDGFVGNVVLKLLEGMSIKFFSLIKENVMSSIRGKTGAFILRPTFNLIKDRLNYEIYGAAPLLGVNGICLIGHGKSTPTAVKNALKFGARMIDEHLINEISISIKGESTN